MNKRFHAGRYNSRKQAESYASAMTLRPGMHAEVTEGIVFDVWIVEDEKP